MLYHIRREKMYSLIVKDILIQKQRMLISFLIII